MVAYHDSWGILSTRGTERLYRHLADCGDCRIGYERDLKIMDQLRNEHVGFQYLAQAVLPFAEQMDNLRMYEGLVEWFAQKANHTLREGDSPSEVEQWAKRHVALAGLNRAVNVFYDRYICPQRCFGFWLVENKLIGLRNEEEDVQFNGKETFVIDNEECRVYLTENGKSDYYLTIDERNPLRPFVTADLMQQYQSWRASR